MGTGNAETNPVLAAFLRGWMTVLNGLHPWTGEIFDQLILSLQGLHIHVGR
jgi:hypothetical protein